MQRLIFFILVVVSFLATQETELENLLSELSGVRYETMEADSPFVEKYRLFVTQPLDHKNNKTGVFEQQVILSHRDFDQPTVMITEGYGIGRKPNLRELSEMLETNEIQVEYRYHGKSKPDSLIWEYLTIKQAADDHHLIRQLFDKIYEEPWIATGFSKGGQTTICYRYFYPNDVAVSVPYVAPLNHALEDPRIDEFFENVGTPDIRKKLIAFQRIALKNKKELLPRFHWYAKGKNYTYSVGEEKAFEYAVLEYPFSFWQYNQIPIEEIPGPNASLDEILEHLLKVIPFRSYSDASMNSPSMYQFVNEFGYYGYVQKNVKDLLSDYGDYPNSAYAPQDGKLEFNPDLMEKISNWLDEEGNNFIYIYGENDPWGATRVIPSSQTNSRLYEVKKGTHLSYLNDLSEAEQKEIIDLIKGWLK